MENYFKSRNKKTKETCLKKYGVESPNSVEAVKEKKRLTNAIDKDRKDKEKIKKRERALLASNPGKTLEEIYHEQGLKAIKKSKENDPNLLSRLHKTKETNHIKYGKEFASQTDEFKKCVYETNKRNKHWFYMKPNPHETWKEYSKEVRRWTSRNIRVYGGRIPEYCTTEDRQLDHMISVYLGFCQNISPYIIAHPANLRYISKEENLSKWVHCTITYEKLLRRIVSFELIKEDKFLKSCKTASLFLLERCEMQKSLGMENGWQCYT